MPFQKLRKNLTEAPFDDEAKYSIVALTEAGMDEITDSGIVKFLEDNPLFKIIYKSKSVPLLKEYEKLKEVVSKVAKAPPAAVLKVAEKDWLKLTSRFNDLLDGFNAFLDEYSDWKDYDDVSTDSRLRKSVARTEWEGWRDEVVELLNIRDTGHSGHGSNFNGKQTLAQVIENLMDKVSSTKTESCAKLIYKEYGYVINAL